MLKRKKTSSNNDIYMMFIGEYVEIVLSIFEDAKEETEDSFKSYSGPIKMAGYFLDVFDDYYVLGDQPDQATSIVKKDKVISVTISQSDPLTSAYDSILDTLPSKPNKQEIN